MSKQKLASVGEGKSVNVSSTRSRRYGVIDRIEFGPHRFFNVGVVEGSMNSVGLPFLRRFEVELNLPNQTAQFRTGLRINDADSRSRAGISAKRVGGKTIVCDINPSSEAAKSGIVDGDQIQSINGFSPDNLTLRKIAALLSRPGSTVTITFQKGDVTKEVVCRLQDDPEPYPAESPHELIDE